MQGVTAIAPAIAGMFTIPFIVLNAGVNAPLAYLGAFVIALMLGYVLAQFTKHMTSAGTYYTFISNSLGERWGFLVAWTYLLFYPVVVAQVGSFMGSTLQSTLGAEYGWTVHWWYFMVFLIVLVALTAWRGIELSTSLVVVLGIIETLIVLALAISGFADPGSGGVNLHWLNPSNAPSGHGLFLGVVFAIFAISGWDAAAPLGEESEDPKRNVPRGVLGCIIILGIFLVFVSWGQTTGWGTNHMASFAASPQLPAFVLGHKFWGGAWIIVLIALFNSAIAVAIATTNSATRFIYGMARTGVLPKRLTAVHPRFKTPTAAIQFQTVINVLLGIVLPLAVGVANVYNITGTWFTFALAPVYIAANIGVFVYYRRNYPDELHWFKHVARAVDRIGRACAGRLLLGQPAAGVSGQPGAVHRARLDRRRRGVAGLDDHQRPWRPPELTRRTPCWSGSRHRRSMPPSQSSSDRGASRPAERSSASRTAPPS